MKTKGPPPRIASRRAAGGRPNILQRLIYQDQLNPVATVDASGNVLQRFVSGTRINVPDYMVADGTTYRLISDHLGSVRLVVDATTGVVAQRLDYDEFGNVTRDTSPGLQPFGFAGGLYDADTGLVRFGARDYDADTGRWTAKDPILFNGGQVNLYVYVGNDPVNWIDTRGLWSLGGGAYYGVGGGFTIGQNPDGSWFFSIDVGVGFGASVGHDLNGQSPTWGNVCDAPAFGAVSGFIEGSVSIVALGASAGIKSGIAATPTAGVEPFTTGWNTAGPLLSPGGIGAMAAGGVRISIGP
jgi:RHS repeat-associated protein